MFLRHRLTLAAAGIASALLATAALTRVIMSLLFEIKPFDPVTFAAAPAALIGAALLASYLPALRATGVDPLEALRSE
jgi:ABC-type antimicrobial peptide transport system permease subunit